MPCSKPSKETESFCLEVLKHNLVFTVPIRVAVLCGLYQFSNRNVKDIVSWQLVEVLPLTLFEEGTCQTKARLI